MLSRTNRGRLYCLAEVLCATDIEALEIRHEAPYNLSMSDPTNRPVSDWLADLEISEAELEAGMLVPGETVLAEIQAAITRLDAKLSNPPPRKAVPLR